MKSAADEVKTRAVDADEAIVAANSYFERQVCEDGAQVQTQALYAPNASIYLQFQAQSAGATEQAQYQTTFKPSPGRVRQLRERDEQMKAQQATLARREEEARCCRCKSDPSGDNCSKACGLQQFQCPGDVYRRQEHIP